MNGFKIDLRALPDLELPNLECGILYRLSSERG